MSDLGEDTITVLVPVSRGPNGDPIPGTGGDVDIDGCSVQPRTSTEAGDGRDMVITGLVVFIPADAYAAAGVTIDDTSTIRWRGDKYAVDGEPGPWRDLSGDDDNVQVALRRVKG